MNLNNRLWIYPFMIAACIITADDTLEAVLTNLFAVVSLSILAFDNPGVEVWPTFKGSPRGWRFILIVSYILFLLMFFATIDVESLSWRLGTGALSMVSAVVFLIYSKKFLALQS